jgi:hypothetical protein
VKLVNASNETVVFTWIAADPTVFETIVKSEDAKRNPEAILNYLKVHVPDDYWEKEPGWEVLKDEFGITAEPGQDVEFELPKLLRQYPCNMQPDIDEKYRGFRLLAVTGGQVNSEETQIERRRVCVDVKPVGGHKFNLDMIADMYKDSYMIVVASFPDSGGSAGTKLPVYVKLENSQSPGGDSWFDEITAVLADPKSTGVPGRTFENVGVGYGTVTNATDQKTNRRYFKVKAPTAVLFASLIMLQFASKDFAHMIPEGAATAESADKIFYGPTNYALYIDVEPPYQGAGGGFGVLLNGSSVHYNSNQYASGGYGFQFDPGANGFLFRYFGYKGTGYSESLDPVAQWGVRSMYFYDAAKSDDIKSDAYNAIFPAPRKISFFTPTSTDVENFNENAGAAPDANLYYRLPLSAIGAGYKDGITASDFSAALEGRNNRYIITNSTYGQSYGMDAGVYSAYSPKRLQSWHKYPWTKIPPENDKRLGFRWDHSWHIHKGSDNAQRKLWEARQILKLTVLEVTRNITANEIEDDEWKLKIHHDGETLTGNTPLTALGPDAVIHASGDLFVRAELIHLNEDETNDWYDSRYYVYSKPAWFGKFKGDAWRGDDPSPFKKLGNAMQHIVPDPEPARGNAQSFRRRGMRVRSWKEAFLGWDFGWIKRDSTGRYQYVWRNFVNRDSVNYNADAPFEIGDKETMPPDFFKTVYGADGRIDGSTRPSDSVWIPPIAIDMNNVTPDFFGKVGQSGGAAGNTFGQYMSTKQYVERTSRDIGGNYTYAYNGVYGTDDSTVEGSRIYGRLSFLRPWRATPLPNQTTPIFGLYAMRGWDLGTSFRSGVVYDSTDDTPKRFLTVFQGLRLPYQPTTTVRTREPNGKKDYAADRKRTIGFRFWGSGNDFILYDSWIGEGFSPSEVRAILGLREKKPDEGKDDYIRFIRGAYVYSNATDALGESLLEKASFYMPMPEAGED